VTRAPAPLPQRLALVALLAAGVGTSVLAFGPGRAGGVPATPARTSASPTIITVRAGSPLPLSFTLSRASNLPPGRLTFKVVSLGSTAHDFEVCSRPVTNVTQNACAGIATKRLRPGQSATLTVVLKRPGRYEYLSTLPGQAAGGMKGLIGVGVTLSTPPPPTATTTPSTTTTSTPGRTCVGRCTPIATTTTTGKPPAVETLVGDPTVGAPLFASNCGSCHILAAAGTTGSSGPDLDSFAPTQEQVVAYVIYGSDAMPAFGGTLTGSQINAVAAYVYASTHGP
jgi:mono/diheme cytochrome c family protein/uncharacterized cupredoxin-like copper-binding protein